MAGISGAGNWQNPPGDSALTGDHHEGTDSLIPDLQRKQMKDFELNVQMAHFKLCLGTMCDSYQTLTRSCLHFLPWTFQALSVNPLHP